MVSQRLRTVWSHYLWTKQNAEMLGKFPPSTAPCYPTPGKRFLIIRTEYPPNQAPNTFDQFCNLLPAPDFRVAASAIDDMTPGLTKTDGGSTPTKKKWSLLGKVLSFSAQQANGGSSGKRTWDEELEQARRETAASRAAAAAARKPTGPPPPPKPSSSTTVMSSSDSGSSTGSAPVYEASTVVFRFVLSWQGMQGALPPALNRILTRPRLPAAAQARVSARSAALSGAVSPDGRVSRSQSPPPVRPGLPPDTRRISGLMQTGLVSEARNARPLSLAASSPTADTEGIDMKRLSLDVNITTGKLFDGPEDDYLQPPISPSFDPSESDRGRQVGPDSDATRFQHHAVRAVRPTGIYASGAVYAGRALAEWSIVVGECNNFVERRREEGVLGLAEVEVPVLSVEGLGLRQRG